MRIALFGANGQVGKRIAAEALDRGHDVLAVVRNPAVARLDDRVTFTAGDATFPPIVAQVVGDADVVVSAVGPRKLPPAVLVKAARGLIEGMTTAGVGRLVVIGCSAAALAPPPAPADGPSADGAAPASAAPAPAAPAEDDPGPSLADVHLEVLEVLRGAGGLDWTWVAPGARCQAGERTGAYVTDGDAGDRALTLEDLAVAVVDELETPRASRAALTVLPA